MRYILVLLLVLASVQLFAKNRQWEQAKVVRLTQSQDGRQVVVLPMGTGLYGAMVPTRHAFYWLRTEKYTYVVPNYCKGAFVQRWLRVTIGGESKVFAENSKTLHIIDDDGKERALSIVQRIANQPEALK